MTESPFAPGRRYLPERGVHHHVDQHYPIVLALSDSCARPSSSGVFAFRLLVPVFAGCCEPLLDSGRSRRYLCNPYVGAWPPIPPRLISALARFFPVNNGLTSVVIRSAREKTPAMQLLQGRYFGTAGIY